MSRKNKNKNNSIKQTNTAKKGGVSIDSVWSLVYYEYLSIETHVSDIRKKMMINRAINT